jgi:hypothetical protein
MAAASATPGMIARAESTRDTTVSRRAGLIEDWRKSMAELIGVTPVLRQIWSAMMKLSNRLISAL